MECVLKYPGSKWNIASAIVNLIPEHHSYVEPYFGSGAVFFNKNPSNIETINDLDDDKRSRYVIPKNKREEKENETSGQHPA